MNEFFQQHAGVIVAILSGVIALLLYFIKEDRMSVKQKIKDNANRIKEVEQNYNTKFEKVYDKQDNIEQRINENHVELMKAIGEISVKVVKLEK